MIADVEPDLVLSHWLHIGLKHRQVIRAAGLPHAVRCHGFDYDERTVEALCKEQSVLVHLFPHLVGRFAGHPSISVDPVGFDPNRFEPRPGSDRRLVARIAAGLLTKDLETFLLAAKRCPDHRFVLGLGHSYKAEERTDLLIERARELDSPVEIRVDLSHAEAAELTMAAGIYLHTHGESHPVGMPISIAEAMASGSYVIARDLPGMAAYLDDGGDLYRGVTAEERADHAAALIRATSHWSDEAWHRRSTAALDRAWVSYPSDVVCAQLISRWRERLGVPGP